ncbi:MAG: RNA polymerase sigma factor [Solirubrobacterales bacterium]|nr:RNA polymerase sigma factor [Solirubrobacterales bacterium]
MEASALARASRGGLLARRSPLLRFEPDDRLVKLIRAGHDGAFEVLFRRYHGRLLSFCSSMLKSRQDAEDVLQDVFTNAHAAMVRDERPINVRPWLYRIARNRCLNHLRKPVPQGQDSMDIHPYHNGTTTAEHVQNREELRQVLADVRTLPETQRTALLLRESDQLSYEEIAVTMQTTVPSIKSLLVRARIGLAESSQARMLTCDEVQVELAEAAEGLTKTSGPARKHVRSCDGCGEFRSQLRTDRKALAALFPIGPFALLKGGILAKLVGGGGAGGSSVAGSGAVGAGTVGGASAAGGVSGGVGGFGILGSAIGAKAVAGMATAALLTAGAVEVRNMNKDEGENAGGRSTALTAAPAPVTPEADATHVVARYTPAPAAKAAEPTARSDAGQQTASTSGTDQREHGAEPAAAAPADKPAAEEGDEEVAIGGAGEVPAPVGAHDGQAPEGAPAASTTIPVATAPPTEMPQTTPAPTETVTPVEPAPVPPPAVVVVPDPPPPVPEPTPPPPTTPPPTPPLP